jgi:hypothetical protein
MDLNRDFNEFIESFARMMSASWWSARRRSSRPPQFT